MLLNCFMMYKSVSKIFSGEMHCLFHFSRKINSSSLKSFYVSPLSLSKAQSKLSYKSSVFFYDSYKHLLNNENYSYSEWEIHEKEICENNPKIRPHNFEMITLNILKLHNDFQLYRSFIEYLQNKSGKLGVFTIANFMLYCSDHMDKCSSSEILKLYDELRSITTVLDSFTADCVIRALCLTEEWKVAITVLEEMVEYTAAVFSSYEAIICASFFNSDPKIGWKYISKISSFDRILSSETLTNICEWCIRAASESDDKGKEEFRKFLQLLADSKVIVSKHVADCIQRYICNSTSKKESKFNHSKMLPNFKCSCCLNGLKSSELNLEEFNLLRQWLEEKVLISRNVFLNSTPKEVDYFYNFVKNNGPFDYVIDGLNVSYRSTKLSKSDNLKSVVKHLTGNERKKILVVGRKHMNSWAKHNMDYIRSKAACFFSSNISEDDPFLLISAFLSGHQSQIVSNDFLRNHLFSLGNRDIQELFRKWQQTRQLQVQTINHKNIQFKESIKHVQWSNWSEDFSQIHIPYSNDENCTKSGLELHSDWLCISKNQT